MAILSVVLFVAAALAGLFLLALGLPGTWVLAAAALACVGLHPGVAVSWGMAFGLLGLCVLAELLELVCGVFGAKRYGVSTQGVWASIIGGFLGAIALGAVIPVIGAVPGAFLGSFLGAFGVELWRGGSRQEALRQGVGAFIARMLALVVKSGVALAMAALGLVWLL
jgi:uncharacterized protein